MAVAERTVRQLRLRAASAAQARRGALCIEDALRCASLPDAGAPLLLVRRLSLGRIDASGASQAVALRIEQRLRELTPQWCHGDADGAAQADAVWFADRAQGLTALLLRLADGRPVSAWYWPRLLPADLAPPGGPPTLRAALLALAREPDAPVVLPAAVAELLRRAGPMALRAALSVAEQQSSLRAAGVVASADQWVEALALQAGPAAAAKALRSRHLPEAQRAGTAPDARCCGPAAPPHRPVAGTEPVAPSGGALAAAWPVAPAASRPVRSAAAQRLAQPAFEHTLATAAGGCLFLLPVLARLGFGAWSAATEPALGPAVASRVLAQALWRLRLPDDDPAWTLCSGAADAAADALATGWLTCVRHALRRRFAIGLASLVLRPGRLAWTRSHAEMRFPLAASDLRLRRHGLDLDPGWLPWFGRVVSFHFDHR